MLYNSAVFCALQRFAKHPVFLPNDKELNRWFTSIIIDFQRPVLQEGHQFIPLIQTVSDYNFQVDFGNTLGPCILGQDNNSSKVEKLTLFCP